MKRTVYGAMAAVSLLSLYQVASADQLKVVNNAAQALYLTNNDPSISPVSTSVGAHGNASLDSSQWAEDGAKNIYMSVTASVTSGAKDICQNNPAIAKWDETKVPTSGVLTLSGDSSKGFNCAYSPTDPSSTVSWSSSLAAAHAVINNNPATGEGMLTFHENATDSSGNAISYAAAVIGRGHVGPISVKDGVASAALTGFAGVADGAESITLSASAADVKQPATVSVKVSVPGGGAEQTAYRQMNVGEDYVGMQLSDLIDLGGYFPAPAAGSKFQMSISSMPAVLAPNYALNQDGVLKIIAPVSAQQFKQLSGCGTYTNRLKQADVNIKQCSIGVKDDTTGASRAVPVLINNGLRSLVSPELVNKHIDHQGAVVGPDYFEVAVSGTGSDLNVDLHQYVSDPATQNKTIRFIPDAANVLGHAAADEVPALSSPDAQVAVSDISGLGQVKHGSLSDFGFAIDDSGHLTNKGGLQAGHVYQINVAAVTGDAADKTGSSALEKAYVTFYVVDTKASGDQPAVSFAQWQQGQVPSMSVLKSVNGNQPLTMMYTYTHADPAKDVKAFTQVYQNYAGDIHYGNKQDSLKYPVNVMAMESAGPMYTDNAPYWLLNTSVSNVKDQILQSHAISNAQANPRQWLPDLYQAANASGTPPSEHLNIAPDLTFGQAVRAEFPTYNAEQLSMVTNEILNNYVYADDQGDINASNMGISLDIEKGTGANFTPMFKLLADKLAYQGRFFGYYEFADKSFQPSVVGSMGPLGVAFVSSYDVGGHGSTAERASKQDYIDQGMSESAATQLYQQVYGINRSCNFGQSDPIGRYSWCNLSLSDSHAVNAIAWDSVDDAPNQYHLSTHKVFDLFNGNFSITQPFAESSTDFAYQELFNPNFTNAVAPKAHNVIQDGGGLVQTNPGECAGMDNAWIQSHDTELLTVIQKSGDELTREKNTDYKKLASCLFANVQLASSDGTQKALPVTKISVCGYQPGTHTAVPLSHCMLLSSIPSADGDGSGQMHYATPARYMADNATPYMVSGQLDPHMVGYSLFALQDTASATASGGFYWQAAGAGNYNIAVQEPWYVGGYQLNPADAKPDSAAVISGQLPYDPFYGSDVGKQVIASAWQGVANLQKQFH